MTDEEPPLPEEVLTSAKEPLDDEEISLADNEEIPHALSELTPVYENDRSYFVLGNYDRGPIRRLNLVVDRLNRRTDAYAFRMVDIRGEWDNSIQKFCQTIAGQRLRRWLYRRLRRKQIDYLRSDTERAWGTSQPTQRARQQAEAIASKTAQPLWGCSIRVLVLGAGEYTQARVRELTAGFGRFENSESGQSFRAVPVRHTRTRNVYGLAKAVADRRFRQYSLGFRAAPEEVGALLAVPDREQQNVTRG